MLLNRMEDAFSGNLEIWGLNCSFEYNHGLLTIRPYNITAESFVTKCRECGGNYDKLGWVFGKLHEKERDVAFFLAERQGPLCYSKKTLTLAVDIVQYTYNFIGLDGNYLYNKKDLHGFTAIDFAGKAVDAIYNPKFAVDQDHCDDHTIRWKPIETCTKKFDSEVNGHKCKLIFSIVVDREDNEFETISLGTVHAIVRIGFSERQSLSMIEPCWQAICTFLSFCLGRHNVTNLQIGLWDEEVSLKMDGFFGDIDCVINTDKEDDIRLIYPTFRRFQVNYFGEKTGSLFQLINDHDRKPFLGFLPRSNTDYTIDRNKIRDLCTAYEVEYDCLYKYVSGNSKNPFNSNLLNPSICTLVKQLQMHVKQFRKDHPDEIDDNENSYIQSSLSVISWPLKKKITCIYNRYKHIINSHAADLQVYTVEHRINVSEKATESDIGWIVRTRNSVTHSIGYTDNIIPNMIYNRLTIVLFCSLLERTGYSIEEISQIINSYFAGYNKIGRP